MKSDWFYKLPPILFGLLGLSFGAGCFLVESYSPKGITHMLYWTVFFTIQTATGVILGLLFKRIYFAAYTDALTGLWNYRYFYKTLLGQLATPASSFCLVMLDIDNFKQINDSKGHPTGDMVLRELSAILRSNCRNTDTVTRLSGDEFALILPNTPLKKALTVAERIRHETATQLAPYQATISVGITSSWPGATGDRLISVADQALYKAKVDKNQVVHYSTAEI
ncbi:MAG TPA: GGDEF domain-containing protein [Selenomonadales bacterium]|nr:GGDEF domain-containing protein [Selenomonadales bacterium]